jgi:hypothetical protein
MQYFQFILRGNSNKELDALSKELVNAIRSAGGIKAGPIAPSKGKRLVYCYTNNDRIFTKLMAINANKYKKVTKIVNLLERPQ